MVYIPRQLGEAGAMETCARETCTREATHQVQVVSPRGNVLLDRKLCDQCTSQELVTGSIGIADVVVTKL
jgi:hypothetical protein